MTSNKDGKGFWMIILLVVAALLGFVIYESLQPGQYDSFAQCLGDKGAKFYGAFWCPHCQAQKALFGKSKDLLPYIECSTADGKGQTQICKDKNIQYIPTWIFADGTVEAKPMSLADLAEKTSCPLPQ